jgi:uncharacterized membrane protein YcaP (DUF421 family)
MLLEWLVRNLMPLILLLLLGRLAPKRLGKLNVTEVFLINAVGDLAAHAVFGEDHPLLSGLGSVALWLLVVAVGAAVARRSSGFRRLYYGGGPEQGEEPAVELRRLSEAVEALTRQVERMVPPKV